MKRFVLSSLLILVFVSVHAQSARTSWPMINGDARHSSYAALDLSLPLQIVDTLHISYRRENGMALWQNMLFLADYAADSNRLVVSDVTTSDSLWSFIVPHTGGGMEFIPAVAEGVVLVGGQGARGLYALDAMNGDSLWFLPVNSLYTRCPVISDSMVYLCAYDSLTCVNLHSGKIYWSFVAYTPQISPVVDASQVYSCTHDFLYALNKISGDTMWVNDSFGVGDFESLAVDSQYLYTGYLTSISAINKSSGDIAWSVELDTTQELMDFPNAFALSQEYLLVKYFEDGSAENQFLLLDKNTGMEVNRYTGTQMTYAAPTILNTYLVDYYAGDLKILDLVSGTQLYEKTGLPVNSYPAQIIAANDRIYIAGNGPNVIVLEGATSAVSDHADETLSFTVFPNPIKDELGFSFVLDRGSHVVLEVFSATGVLADSRDLGVLPRGKHHVSLPAGNLSPGLYSLHLKTDGASAVQKILKVE